MQSMLLTKWLILGKVIHNTEFAYDVQVFYLQKEIEGNLLGQNLNKLESELSRI